MALELNQGKYYALSRRGVCTKTRDNIPANEHRRKRAGRCTAPLRQINMTSWDNLTASWKIQRTRADKGRCIQLRPIIIFLPPCDPSRCSRIPSLFDCAATRLCAMENWNIQERCRLKRERDANNSDIPGPIGSRPGNVTAPLGNRPRKLNSGRAGYRRSDRPGNLSCHKEISYTGPPWNALPCPAGWHPRILVATCCSLSLSPFATQPPPRASSFSHVSVFVVPR